jgi:hypothetical protein
MVLIPAGRRELTHVFETARKRAVNLGHEIAVPRVVPTVPHPASTRLTTQHVHPGR